VRVVDASGTVTIRLFSAWAELPPRSAFTLDDIVEFGTIFANVSLVYRTESIRDPDPFDEVGLDWHFQLKAARHGKLHYLADVMADYRKHAASMTHQVGTDLESFRQHYDVGVRTLERIEGAVHDRARWSRALARVHYQAAGGFLERREYPSFRRAIEASWAAWPTWTPNQRLLHRWRRAIRSRMWYSRLRQGQRATWARWRERLRRGPRVDQPSSPAR